MFVGWHKLMDSCYVFNVNRRLSIHAKQQFAPCARFSPKISAVDVAKVHKIIVVKCELERYFILAYLGIYGIYIISLDIR